MLFIREVVAEVLTIQNSSNSASEFVPIDAQEDDGTFIYHRLVLQYSVSRYSPI